MAVSGERKTELRAAQRALIRDVAIPDVVDPERRARCEFDFAEFLSAYFRGRGDDYPDDPEPLLTIPCGDFHRDLCDSFQRRVLYGGLQAETAPRGYGKDTIVAICGALWACLYGHTPFFVIAAYEAGAASDRIAAIKMQLETNPLLREDFPEVCAPIKALNRSPQKARSQTHQGEYTRIEWTTHIVLPTIPGSKASGAIIAPASINASIRGLNINGRRPSMVVITDPQTDETAKSKMQTDTIIRKINKDIGGLGTRGRAISCLVLATIIRADDVAHQLTNRELKPQWHGVVRRALINPPEREDLWEDYIKLRHEGSKKGDEDGREAHRFYLANREEMDAGSLTLWAEAYDRNPVSDGTQKEVSNLQSLYNVIAEFGREAFETEYQNNPPPEDANQDQGITVEEICERLSGVDQGIIPDGCDMVTRFIDIGTRVLWDTIIATDRSMNRIYVVSYGRHLTFAEEIKSFNPLNKDDPGRPAIERRVHDLLNVLAEEEERGIVADIDGRSRRIDLTLVDTRFMETVVQGFVREKGHKYRAAGGLPLRGKQTVWGAARGAFAQGDNWFAKRTARGYAVYNVNADYWKTFVRERLLQSPDSHGAIQLFGNTEVEHKTFAEHMLSERFDLDKGRWLRNGSAPNHWLDCTSGALVAASMCGASLIGDQSKRPSRSTSLKGWFAR